MAGPFDDLAREAAERARRHRANGHGSGKAANGRDESALAFTLEQWDARAAYVGEAPSMRWLVRDAIPRGKACLLAATGGVGKSYLLLELGLRISCGPKSGPFMEPPILGGDVVEHGAAVVITAEDDRGTVHRRLQALDPDGSRQAKRRHPLHIVPLPDAGGPLHLVAEHRGEVMLTPQFHELHGRLKAVPNLALVVLDPLQTFVLADVNADPKVATFTMTSINMLAAETTATVAVSHHLRKEREPPKSLAEARQMIRGSSALVDQSRVSIVLWTPTEDEIRKICRALDRKFDSNAVVYGGTVKENDGIPQKRWTLLREPSGLLRDVTLDLAARRGPRGELLDQLVRAVAAAAVAGQPYTKTGQAGLYARRATLPGELASMGRNSLEAMAQALETEGRIVAAIAGGTTAKWLDVPDGPFARGKGEFSAGAWAGRPGPKGSPNG